MAPPNREVQQQTVAPTTTDATNQQGSEHQINDASSAFLTQLQTDRSARSTEQTREVAKAPELLSAVKPGETAFYPNELVREAQGAGREISRLLQAGNPEDKIQVRDASGRITETTVEQRVESLRKLMVDDCTKAIVASNELIKNNPNLEADYNRVTAQLQTAARQAGYDVNSPNFAEQAKNNPQLADLARQQELLGSARMAPATAMLTLALLKAEGLTVNPGESVDAYKTRGMPKPTKEELTDAFMLVSQAGRTNPEVAASDMYRAANQAIKADYAQSQGDKGQQIVTLLKDADAMVKAGNSGQAEAKYKEAYELGETIDQKFLAAQLRLPDNQNNPEVRDALVGVLASVKEARMHYAKHLVDSGKYADALPIALSVGADTPEFARQDATYNKLVSDATFGKAMPQGEIQAHQAEFAKLMQEDNKDPDKFNKAQKELDLIMKNFQETKAQLEQSAPKIAAAKKEVEDKLADLQKKKDTTDPEEFKIEQQRLENEKKVFEMTEAQNASFLKQESYFTYMKGCLLRAKGDGNAAHDAFEQVKTMDPELAKNPDLQLDALLEDTREKGFFEKNWQWIATGLAIGAGVCVGILCAPTGPLALGAAIGTTGAILTAIGGGAAAGALVYSGTKGLAVGFDKVGVRDLGQGALLGASGALPVSGLFTGTAAGGAAATSTTLGGRAVSAFANLGITGRTLAAGSVIAAGDQGLQIAYDNKSFGDAARDFAWQAPLNAATMGWSSGATSTGGRLMRIGFAEGVPKVGIPAAIGTYAQVTEHVLDPSDPKENEQIWERYNQVNPSLYRPETPPPAQPGDRPAAPAPRKMTEEEIERLRNQEISDQPIQ